MDSFTPRQPLGCTSTAEKVLAVLQPNKLKDCGNGKYRCNSPFRQNSNSHAFSILIHGPEHGAWTDHVSKEGGSLYTLADRLHIERPSQPNEAKDPPQAYRDLADYAQTKHGVPEHAFIDYGWSNVRHKGTRALQFKTATGVRWRYIDGGEQKYDSPAGYRRCLYGLDRALEIAAQTDQPLVLCNGEASVVSAQYRGVAAFCQTQGENTLAPENLAALQEAYPTGNVLIVAFDCDKTGRTQALKVVQQLRQAGYDARAVDLRGDRGDDLSDFTRLHEEHSATALQELPELQASVDDPRPEIAVQNLDLPAITIQAWNAIVAANNPPTVFRRGGELVRLETLEDGAVHVESMDARRMTGLLSRTAHWIRVSQPDKQGTFHKKDVVPPGAVVDDCMVNIDPRIPSLTRIVHAPVFGPDGTLLEVPGYHRSARVFYDARPGTVIEPVPTNPTADDLARAKTLILNELLGEFPFVSDADRAHAVSLLLLPFVRALINGPTPLHLIEAPVMGSGKGLLSKVLLIPALGALPTPMTEAAHEEEWRKRITSALLAAPTTVVLDNLNRPLDSGALAAALTTNEWSDRLLGKSEQVRVAVRCVWVATANNTAMSGEVSRRCIRIRIDPRIDKPWNREGFKYPRLEEWAAAHRGELIWAALVLCKYGLRYGTQGRVLGSYEAWADIMGRILRGTEIVGFLDNLDALYEAADAEGAAWRTLCAAWWVALGDEPTIVSELFPLVADLEDALKLQGKDEKARRSSFGKALARVRDRVFSIEVDGEEIRVQIVEAGEFRRARRWRLIRVNVVNVVSVLPSTHARFEKQLDDKKIEMGSNGCQNVHNTHNTHTDDGHKLKPPAGTKAAVQVDIAQGRLDAARNRIKNHPECDWSKEEADIAAAGGHYE